jgi:hypothetical protein
MHKKMNNYFVLQTPDNDHHVVYRNHRDELVSVAVCSDEKLAMHQAALLNTYRAPTKQNTGNRYLRRYKR